MLTKYGYHGIRHISHMLRYEWEQRRDVEYVSTILWSIGRMVGGENYPMPSYNDMKNPKPEDNRTGDEIISNLIDKLKGGGE